MNERLLKDSMPGPDGQLHIDDESCWCEPEVLQVCPECCTPPEGEPPSHWLRVDHLEPPPEPDCWRCQGRGLVPQYDDELSVLVVHRSNAELLGLPEPS